MSGFDYLGDKNIVNEVGSNTEELPDLCHKCGRCCKSATTYTSYSDLMKRVEEGDEEASEFLRVFEPYDSLEDARKAVPGQVTRVLEEIEQRDDMSVEDTTFYHCRYVTPEGICGIYDTRPRCCRDAPVHGWSMMPPGCGFEGWQFQQREQHKQSIRNLKTSFHTLEQLSPDGKTHPLKPEESLDDLKARIDEKINAWAQYGSETW
jgi:Fe-S-cluster containining protein